MTDPTQAKGEPYKIISVEKTAAPSGASGANWYRYEISQGDNTISGFRRGNLREVTAEVEEIVAQSNQRQMGKRGRVQLVTAPKRKTAK